MANLDTRSKRASSVGILLPSVLSPVLPDGALSAGDRQHIALSYSGILASAAAVAAVFLAPADAYAISSQDSDAYSVRSQGADTYSVRGDGSDLYVIPGDSL